MLQVHQDLMKNDSRVLIGCCMTLWSFPVNLGAKAHLTFLIILVFAMVKDQRGDEVMTQLTTL